VHTHHSSERKDGKSTKIHSNAVYETLQTLYLSQSFTVQGAFQQLTKKTQYDSTKPNHTINHKTHVKQTNGPCEVSLAFLI